MKTNGSILTILLINFLLVACNNTRHIPKNDRLYVGAKVDVHGPSLTTREKKVLRSDLSSISRPKANSKFLGMRMKLSFYNLFHNKKSKFILGEVAR